MVHALHRLRSTTAYIWYSHCEELQAHLLGLRGILALQTALWVFCSTFIPNTLVFKDDSARAASFSASLGRGLSVLFWNPYLISTTVIILSGRTIPIPYLRNPSRQSFAGSLFRRSIRLGFPTGIALTLVYGIASSTNNFEFLTAYAERSGIHLQRPYELQTFLVLFNTIFDAFWTQIHISLQASNTTFPTQTLWIISLVYMQSYTVYMTQLIIPYTRSAWRIKMFVTFIILAWWVQSWAWYSMTGLLLADLSINASFKSKIAMGFRLWKLIVPTWILFVSMILIGLLLQLLWVDWRPEYQWYEVYGHSEHYNEPKSAANANDIAARDPTARMDTFLIVLGFMLIMETTNWVQWALSWWPIVEVGRRSFSQSAQNRNASAFLFDLTATPGIFLTAPIVCWTVCIQVWLRLDSDGVSRATSSGIAFLSYLALTAIFQEIFYWSIDRTSQSLAHWAWVFVCD